MAYMFGRRNQYGKKCRWRLDTWWARIRSTLNEADRPLLPSLDLHRPLEREARWEVFDCDSDGAVKALVAGHVEGDLAVAL